MDTFALKGNIVHTPTPEAFVIYDDSYLVAEDGKVRGIWKTLPKELEGIDVYDYTGRIIIPGMADMHIHAPQYGFRGLGMEISPDSVWTTWFENYSLPEESHYSDREYAEKAYSKFADDMLHTTTTRLCVFGTIHREGTEILMKKLSERGFAAYVGKLNMDRNSIEGLQETTEESLSETRRWLEETKDGYGAVKPMITPRYIPSCSDRCMEGLEKLKDEFDVPVQSHLSEALDEIEWVKGMKKEISFYGEGYEMYGMLGSKQKTVMAHCVYPVEEEFELMARNKNLWVAHCPESNLHTTGSGAPVRRYLEAGIHVGIGSDVAGSHTINLCRAAIDAITASKVWWAANVRNGDPYAKKNHLTLSEAFHIATKGGASFWGEAGSFEEGSLFDAVVLDDTRLRDFNSRSTEQRLERLLEQSDDREVEAKFINGRKVL